MKYTIRALSDLTGAKIVGNSELLITAPNRIEVAQGGEITFLQHAKYTSYLSDCQASAIVTKEELADFSLPFTWLIVQEPYIAFAWIMEAFYPKKAVNFQHHNFFLEPQVVLGENVKIGYNTYIGSGSNIGDNVILYPQVYIGNGVKIGQNTIIYPGVRILENSIIGDDCIIHSGAVIGSEGFGFIPREDGSVHKIPQIGNVVIQDGVEIGANTCIDRATLGSTMIRSNVKLDNLIQIGHNVVIGENSIIAAQAGIAGSSVIGENNQIGGQAGFAPHVTTAPNVKVNAQSGVSKSILKEGSVMTGSPAQPYMEFNRSMALMKSLRKEKINPIQDISGNNQNLEIND